MPKFLTYGNPIVEVRTIEVLSEDGFPFYIKAKRTGDKIIVETISNAQGHVCTAADLLRETHKTVPEIKKIIETAFS
jgi:hypothetical protein